MQTDFENRLKSEIDAVVDAWVSTALRDRFYHAPVNRKKVSLWDRFKQGVTNWWWGPKGDRHNPYRWQNRFGDDLGSPHEVAGDPRSARRGENRSEAFDPSIFTLGEYGAIKRLIESVDLRLDESSGSDDGFDNLRLMGLLRAAAEDLKIMLFNALKRTMYHSRLSAGGTSEDERGSAPPGTTKITGDGAGGAKAKPAGGAKAKPAGGAKAKPAGGAKSKEAAEKRKAVEAARKREEKVLEGFFGPEVNFVKKLKDFLIKNEEYKAYREALNSWFDEEKKKLIDSAPNDLKEREKYIAESRKSWRSKMMEGGEFIKKISEITGKSGDEIMKAMEASLSPALAV